MTKLRPVRGIAGCVAALVILLSFILPPAAVSAKTSSGGEIKTVKKQYEIAMVFDNSFSMFEKDNVRWSRAKFAMEIFASMLDYDGGDALTIFPMWQVATDGSRPELESGVTDATASERYLAGEKDKVEIRSRDDIDKISKMFTIHAAGTPFDPVVSAMNYLKSKNADRQKWLIILTDGEFDSKNGQKVDRSAFSVSAEIAALSPDGIRTQYLAIDMAGTGRLPSDADGFFVDSASGREIQDKLVKICNRIFERDELTNALSGSALHLGLSMRRLIVFVQGQGAKIEGLTDGAGNKMEIVMDSHQRRFSDYSVGHFNPLYTTSRAADETLYGQVVTFASCRAGDYTLELSGYDPNTGALQIFYEPDVRVQTHLFDAESGRELTEADAVYPGKYTVKSAIVDRQTGEDVTGNPLLGSDMTYTIAVENAGETYEIANGDTIDLKEGEANVHVSVTYLGGKYTIENDDSPFFRGIRIQLPPKNELKLKATCLQRSNWYQLTDPESWQPVRVDVTYNGEKLTDEEMAALDFTYALGDTGTVLSHRILSGESACEIAIGRDEAGAFHAPEETIALLRVEAKTKDEFDREISDSTTTLIEIHKHSVFFRYLVTGAVLLGLIALALWFMSRKVLPKSVKATMQVFKTVEASMEGQGKATLDRKHKKIKVASPPADESMNCRISFDVSPESRRWTRSKDRRYRITRIYGPASTVERIEINALGYIKDAKGKFVSEDNPDLPLKISPKSKYNIAIFAEEAQLECRIVNK